VLPFAACRAAARAFKKKVARSLPQVAQEVRITIVRQPLVIFCALLFIVRLAAGKQAGRPLSCFSSQLVFSFSLPLAAERSLGGSARGQCIQPLPLQHKQQQRWLKAAVDCAVACLPLRFNTCLFCQPELLLLNRQSLSFPSLLLFEPPK
jgi:hypothetical protein